jgi:hypothetical protein
MGKMQALGIDGDWQQQLARKPRNQSNVNHMALVLIFMRPQLRLLSHKKADCDIGENKS